MLGKVLISHTERTTLAELIKKLINNSFVIILHKEQRAYIQRILPAIFITVKGDNAKYFEGLEGQ